MPQTYEHIQESIESIRSRTAVSPEFGIILGTGLGRLANALQLDVEIPYGKIPHFPVSTVETHAGRLLLGTLSGKSVLAMCGRFHYYEGYSMQQIVFPVRVMKFLGIHTMIVSNAAGGINPLLPPGSIMAITDHINLLGDNPLIGPNDNRIGPRYPDMSRPYDSGLLELVTRIALESKIPLAKGVYAAMTGPSLETRAEYRMLRMLGADAIGMSTVPEVIAAAHAGVKVLGLSVITDACLPDALEPVDISRIIDTANRAEPTLVTLIEKVLEVV
jgi:purine-nucleoside phosphorylase